MLDVQVMQPIEQHLSLIRVKEELHFVQTVLLVQVSQLVAQAEQELEARKYPVEHDVHVDPRLSQSLQPVRQHFPEFNGP